MRDINDDAEAIHFANDLTALFADAVPFSNVEGIRQGVGGVVISELHHADTQTVEQPKHIRIAFHIETTFQGQNHGQFASSRNPPDILRGKRQLHPAGIRFKDSVEGFDQTQSLFDRVVVLVVGILDVEMFDGHIEPTLFRAGIVEAPDRLHTPGIDALVEDRIDHVHVPVDHDQLVVQATACRWFCRGFSLTATCAGDQENQKKNSRMPKCHPCLLLVHAVDCVCAACPTAFAPGTRDGQDVQRPTLSRRPDTGLQVSVRDFQRRLERRLSPA